MSCVQKKDDLYLTVSDNCKPIKQTGTTIVYDQQ